MKNILIRCDANDVNGYGHLSRCLNIARGVKENNKDHKVTFIGEYSAKAVSLIERYHFGFTPFSLHNSDSALNLVPFLKGADCFILDSYKITQQYVGELCNCSFRFCLIADESNIFNCSKVDLVINYAINGEDFDYNCPKQALGLKYFPVKPELKEIRERNIDKEKENLDNILLMIGGHDVHSVGIKLLKLMDNSGSNKKITFISSASFTDKPVLKNNELIILPFVEKIEDVYGKTDLSITGGGLSKYESCYCSIRNACMPQNINEYNDSLHFEKSKLTSILGTAYEYNEANASTNIAKLFTQKRMAHPYIFHTDSLKNLVDVILN